MTSFWIALQFLTTFPVTLKAMPSKQQNARSLLFYPWVGLLIGLILFGVALVLHAIPIILLSSLILVLWIWLTGGLHLDGLADTADAWVGGYGDKERKLKIMKDPSCGPIGVLSLIIVCLLKWSAIYVLLEQHVLLPFIVIPMLGRLTPLFLFISTPYIREKGLGSSITEFLSKPLVLLLLVLGLFLGTMLSLIGFISVSVAIFTVIYLRHKFIQRIGGITGDTVGASIEIIEAMAVMSFAIAIQYLDFQSYWLE
ncbi:adenosylcobinamide-GDP ribazoletransferase [Acinetobacter sp. 194]|uniref:adenosylcobinamide-GDP ribazoletransferase n=1 Tax=Acinetobacter shaoyimingii TaxID=2715164 RepID=UPI00140845D9|nr:adenosylcobinamide-GDP ribazoletransferase [Acinetobacter shaoyimingii]NHB59490.1 adenosylcobinamide-GDP ribazoletransferase [Acinetobacter shaoyimingii]